MSNFTPLGPKRPIKKPKAKGVAQVGKVISEGETEAFNPVVNVGSYNHEGYNPSFEEVQNTVLTGLQKDYPSVTFAIVP